MKKLLSILALTITVCVSTQAQQPSAASIKPDAATLSSIKVPADYSAQLSALQEQSKKLETDYGQVITLFKEYVAKRDAIQAQAAVVITRAALAAHMTIEQLDNSVLGVDDKGQYVWTQKPKAEAAKEVKQ